MTTAISFHNDLANQWEAKYRRGSFRRRADSLLSLVDRLAPASGSWLDAGCGAGVLSRRLAERGHRVTGVDASEKMIDEAARYAQPGGQDSANLSFQVIDSVEQLPCEDGSFDGILCSSVIEYVADPGACLAEFARVLRPDGILIVSIPNRWGLVRNLQKTCFFASGWFTNTPRPAYLRHSKQDYTRKAFVGLLERVGFAAIEVDYFEALVSRSFLAASPTGSLLIVAATPKRSTAQRTYRRAA